MHTMAPPNGGQVGKAGGKCLDFEGGWIGQAPIWIHQTSARFRKSPAHPLCGYTTTLPMTLSLFNFGFPMIRPLKRNMHLIGIDSNFQFFKVFLNYTFIFSRYLSFRCISIHSCTPLEFGSSQSLFGEVLESCCCMPRRYPLTMLLHHSLSILKSIKSF